MVQWNSLRLTTKSGCLNKPPFHRVTLSPSSGSWNHSATSMSGVRAKTRASMGYWADPTVCVLLARVLAQTPVWYCYLCRTSCVPIDVKTPCWRERQREKIAFWSATPYYVYNIYKLAETLTDLNKTTRLSPLKLPFHSVATWHKNKYRPLP